MSAHTDRHYCFISGNVPESEGGRILGMDVRMLVNGMLSVGISNIDKHLHSECV